MGGSLCLEFSASESGKLPDYGNGLDSTSWSRGQRENIMTMICFGETDGLDAIHDLKIWSRCRSSTPPFMCGRHGMSWTKILFKHLRHLLVWKEGAPLFLSLCWRRVRPGTNSSCHVYAREAQVPTLAATRTAPISSHRTGMHTPAYQQTPSQPEQTRQQQICSQNFKTVSMSHGGWWPDMAVWPPPKFEEKVETDEAREPPESLIGSPPEEVDESSASQSDPRRGPKKKRKGKRKPKKDASSEQAAPIDTSPSGTMRNSMEDVGKNNFVKLQSFLAKEQENPSCAVRLEKLMRSTKYDVSTGFIILADVGLNWMDIDIRASGKDTPVWLEVCATLCLVIYTVEMLAITALRGRRVFQDRWFLLDIIIVGSGLLQLFLNAIGISVDEVALLRVLLLASTPQ